MDEQAYIDELTNILLKTGALNPEDAKGLAQVYEESSHANFDYFLLEEDFVQKEELLKGLSILYKVPSVDVDGYFFRTFLLQKFPKDFLLRNAIIPYVQDENMLIIVAADPSDESLLDKIGAYVSYDLQFYVGIYTDIIDAIEEFYDKALTEIPEDTKRRQLAKDNAMQIQSLDNLPYEQIATDESDVIGEEIKQFVANETPQERDDIESRATIDRKRF